MDDIVPIGNYVVVQPTELSNLPSESTTPQIQETILKDPLKTLKGLTDITGGHSLENYYHAHLTSLQRLPREETRTMATQNLFKPSLSRKPYAAVRKDKSGKYSCFLSLEGSFLQIQMTSDRNNFQPLPFKITSRATAPQVMEGVKKGYVFLVSQVHLGVGPQYTLLYFS